MFDTIEVFHNGLEIQDFSNRIPSRQRVYYRCEDIGRYKLIGASSKVCNNGDFELDGDSPYCEASDSESTIREILQKNTFKCPSSIGIFPHPGDCRQFFFCTDGRAESVECPGKEIFDTEKRKCDVIGVAKCTINQQNEVHCPSPFGSYAHPHACNKYIQCVDNKPTIYECDRNQAYNAIGKQCTWRSSVDCFKRNMLKKAEEIDPSVQIDPKPDSSGIAVGFDSKLYVYPGTTFVLNCIFPKIFAKDGYPAWNVQMKNRQISNENFSYKRDWEDGSSVEDHMKIKYGITIRSAHEPDSGTYNCVTAPGKNKSIEVVVTAIDCPVLIIPENEDLEVTNRLSTKMSAEVKFKCKEGVLKGAQSIQCMPSGKWSSNVPTCIPTIDNNNSLKCTRPDISNAKPLQITPDKGYYNVQETIVFSCPEQYRLEGSIESATCLSMSQGWDTSIIPKCIYTY